MMRFNHIKYSTTISQSSHQINVYPKLLFKSWFYHDPKPGGAQTCSIVLDHCTKTIITSFVFMLRKLYASGSWSIFSWQPALVGSSKNEQRESQFRVRGHECVGGFGTRVPAKSTETSQGSPCTLSAQTLELL